MRWMYHDPKNKAEAQERAAIEKKIAAWWAAFEQKTDDLTALFSNKKQWDLPNWMHRHLGAIHPNLMWEYGPAVKGKGHRLVITPETRQQLRPLANVILEHAPKLKGWEFYGHRLPEGLDEAQQMAEVRAKRDVSDYRVRATISDLNLIDLRFVSPSIESEEDQAAYLAALVTTETLLGEEIMSRWIGAVGVQPAGRKKKGDPTPIPLDRFTDTIHSLILSLREQLPQQALFDTIEEAEWSMWKLEPKQAEDYAGQRDLFVGKSAYPTVWIASRTPGAFSSERFSSCGETYCYLKLDGSEPLPEEQFADKSEIEDALDEVLIPAKLGCHYGGGTGLRYSYIDLALTDVDAGIRAVRKRLRTGKLTRRSWIQFYDAELANEWVGIYDDTPPPPMAED